jgi:5-methylcytosine-specific restriction enzyme subunit McrC
MQKTSDHAVLEEQQWRGVSLSPEDADLLRSLNFEVAEPYGSTSPVAEGDSKKPYVVNPRQYVGHFVLPSGMTIVIKPKIEAANIFRMLAYVYLREHPKPFRDADVLYASDQLLFEPLIELFNALVAKRVRRGLYQSYIEHQDNLSVFRGRLAVQRHLQLNLARPDHVFCRYSQQTHDIEDNQIIKWTIRVLLSVFPWSTGTVQSLRANFHQFEAVSLTRPERSAFQNRHYHRLNEDYRLLHDLCRLFLEKKSISERPGAIGFRGFLLNMNELFEQFISAAFQVMGRKTRFMVVSQAPAYLSLYPVRIRPDITIRAGHAVTAIVDAKYKRNFDVYDNPDVYQMLAYATALKCPRTFLVFPTSECDRAGPVEILNSPVTIEICRVDISDRECVSVAEQLAADVLNRVSAATVS